jgi:hypothetical protein
LNLRTAQLGSIKRAATLLGRWPDNAEHLDAKHGRGPARGQTVQSSLGAVGCPGGPVERTGCCIQLLYGMTRLGKNVVKAALAVTSRQCWSAGFAFAVKGEMASYNGVYSACDIDHRHE